MQKYIILLFMVSISYVYSKTICRSTDNGGVVCMSDKPDASVGAGEAPVPEFDSNVTNLNKKQ